MKNSYLFKVYKKALHTNMTSTREFHIGEFKRNKIKKTRKP